MWDYQTITIYNLWNSTNFCHYNGTDVIVFFNWFYIIEKIDRNVIIIKSVLKILKLLPSSHELSP